MVSSRFFCILALLLLVHAAAACAQGRDAYPEDHLSTTELEAHLRFIAADELRGRMTGSPEIEIAARYIAEQFRAAGLETLDGADGFFQQVPLAKVSAPRDGYVVLQRDTLRQGSRMLLLEGGSHLVKAPIVFAGYGISAPDAGHDDYDDVDVKDRIVVIRSGAPPAGELAPYATSDARRAAAAARGAAALVELYDGQFRGRTLPLVALISMMERERFEIQGGSTLPHVLVDDPQGAYAEALLQQEDAFGTLSTPGLKKAAVPARNVVGMVRGSDRTLRDEYVVLMAHYDHIGVGASAPDSIYNGARDNGMGTVALMAAARSLAERPPARSVIFLAVTAEEVGMHGSGYYVEHPLVPLEQTVFVLNNDGAGFNDTGIVTVIGLERSTAGQAIVDGAAAYRLEAIDDPVPEQGLFDRSDNVRFARKGVPAPTFSPGFRTFDEELMKYYHQPADRADEHFDFAYLHRFAQAFARAARNIADMPERPRWTSGDPYEEAGRQLYGE